MTNSEEETIPVEELDVEEEEVFESAPAPAAPFAPSDKPVGKSSAASALFYPAEVARADSKEETRGRSLRVGSSACSPIHTTRQASRKIFSDECSC
jgi:hypothetical protein